MGRKYHFHQVSRKDGIYWHKIKINHRSNFGREEHKKEILTYNQDMKNYRTAKKEIKKEGGKIRKYRNKIIIYGGGSLLSLVSLLTLLSLIPGVTTSGLTDYYCGEYCEIPFTICTSKYDLDFRGDQIQPFYFEGNATLERILENGKNFSFNGNYLKKGNCWNLTAIVRKNEFETIKYGFEMGEINIDPYLFDPKKYKAELTYQIINESKNIKRINLDISDKTLLDIKNKIYQGELINLKKTKYFGDVEVKLMEKVNVTKERVKRTWKCNCTNETYNFTENQTNLTQIKTREVCQTCREYENYTVEEMKETEPETFILKKDKPIYEVEGTGLKIVDLPNGKYGYSVFTNVSILGVEIKGATWWNSSFSYKREINLSNTAGNQTNYQVKLSINTTLLYEAGKLNLTCKDIRFTNSSDDAIDFWIENCTTNNNSTNSTFWVEVPTLTNATNTTIYMYYGNNDVSSESNGINTFPFFDDFEGSGINTSKWEGDTGYTSVANSVMTFSRTGTGWLCVNAKTYTASTPIIYELYTKFKNLSTTYGRIGLQDGDDWANNYLTVSAHPSDAEYFDANKAGTYTVPAMTFNRGVYYEFKIEWTSQTAFYANGVEDGNSPISSTYTPIVDLKPYFLLYREEYYTDWVRTRKYASPEPTVSIGSEEEGGDTTPPTSNSPADASYIQNSAQTIGWILQDETASGNYTVKRNGTIQNASTSWTNNTNLNVWVNTSTVGNNWNYTISFNDSAGNDGTPDSVFINITSAGDPDTKFEIYNGSSWVEFNDTNDIEFRCTPTQTNCEPTNQNTGGSQSIFKITNNGTASGNVSMKINQTFSGIDFKCDDDYTSAGATIFTISYQQIHGTLENGSSIYVSCWTDYSNPTSGGIFEVYTNISS